MEALGLNPPLGRLSRTVSVQAPPPTVGGANWNTEPLNEVPPLAVVPYMAPLLSNTSGV